MQISETNVQCLSCTSFQSHCRRSVRNAPGQHGVRFKNQHGVDDHNFGYPPDCIELPEDLANDYVALDGFLEWRLIEFDPGKTLVFGGTGHAHLNQPAMEKVRGIIHKTTKEIQLIGYCVVETVGCTIGPDGYRLELVEGMTGRQYSCRSVTDQLDWSGKVTLFPGVSKEMLERCLLGVLYETGVVAIVRNYVCHYRHPETERRFPPEYIHRLLTQMEHLRCLLTDVVDFRKL